jgi:hypothetical protein
VGVTGLVFPVEDAQGFETQGVGVGQNGNGDAELVDKGTL